MSSDGQLHNETMVRFERVLPGPIERVWEFLTRGAHLAAWFGDPASKCLIEPRAGGAVRLLDDHIRGVVTQWKPPHRLVYTWNVFSPGETDSQYPESYLAFDLKLHGNDVLLTLTHRPMLAGFEAQTMMGWHTFLEMLDTLLRGGTPEPRAVIMERNRLRYKIEEIKR